MKVLGRARMAGAAVAAAAVIGGGGFALGAVTAEPGRAASPPAAAAQHAGPAQQPDTVQRAGPAAAGYAGVVRQVLPSVVLIRTASGLGSGVVLDDKGNIVTNAHVAGDATRFEVQLSGDPQPREARLVGSYPASDLAVIRVDDRAGLVPASFGDSNKAQVGDVVLAVGNPLGLSGSVTEGIISAAGRVVTEPASASSPGTVLPDAIQTSAPINPGNSGGALVNTAGQVIGIPTAAASGPQGSQAQGIGFAIPANLARDIAGQLIASGHVTSTHRAAIGAQIANLTRADGTTAGPGIVSVTSGGPADRAGLRAGDVIQAVGQTRTPDAAALTGALAARDPGQAVPVTVDRGGQTVTVQVTLGELPGS
ncbi:MAG TPA: trypsin-like peptidase domain-containing protein [Streptosporangiaceae bacterium]|nr:trypsin-like peptidase domain-containing protein [Streptosporangiaceae bacterium]